MTHQRTCDRQTLFLSSGKIASLLLNYRVQSAFSIKNNFIGLRRMDRLFQFLLCGIFISPQQISRIVPANSTAFCSTMPTLPRSCCRS